MRRGQVLQRTLTRRKPRRRLETLLVGEIIDTLNRLHGCKAWRNNTGVAKYGKRKVSYGQLGSGDILGAFCGRAFAVEAKAPKGTQDPAQERWQAEFEAAGGLYILARDVPTVLAALGITENHPARPNRVRIFPR